MVVHSTVSEDGQDKEEDENDVAAKESTSGMEKWPLASMKASDDPSCWLNKAEGMAMWPLQRRIPEGAAWRRNPDWRPEVTKSRKMANVPRSRETAMVPALPKLRRKPSKPPT